jgi:hypothetical protein
MVLICDWTTEESMEMAHPAGRRQIGAPSTHWNLWAALLCLFVFAAGLPGAVRAQYIASSYFKLKSAGFDFGWDSYVAGTPTEKATLDWVGSVGAIRPELVGFMHLRDAKGLCGRMRMDYFTGAHVLLSTTFGGEVCER